MFNKKLLIQYAGTAQYERGRRIYLAKDVSQPEIIRENGRTTVTAEVYDAQSKDAYETSVSFDEDYEARLTARCSCALARITRHMCGHMIAVLLEYEHETALKPVQYAGKTIDPELLKLMQNIADRSETQSGIGALLMPVLSFPVPDTGSPVMQVEFRICRRDSRPYILKNISEFCRSIEKRDTVQYGKSLAFCHTVSNFDPSVHPLIRFLQSLVHTEDGYMQRNTGYYSYYGSPSGQQLPERTLSLKGSYLDSFFDAVKGLPVYVQPDKALVKLEIREEKPELPVKLERAGTGCLVASGPVCLYRGKDYLYSYDETQEVLYRFPMDEDYCALTDYLTSRPAGQCYIPHDYLQQFSRFLYPVLVRNTIVQSDGFDPLDYMPLKPSFEIYLDMPEDSVITCRLYAVYGERKYNVLQGISGEDRRDVTEEKAMDTFVSGWFNAFDSINSRLSLSEDEDKLFALLSEGIPQMQERAAVFVSDAIRKLRVHTMPAVSIGISVDHDLLQIHASNDPIDTARLAEVLSRYERKRKYYRLKNGDFVTVDGVDLEGILSLSEDLSVSPSALVKGKVELPPYRALYLEKYAQMSDMLTEEDSFRTLIEHFEDTSRRTYEIPESFRGELRPYQKEGFRWLCRLRDNGFGALLADEMGLGKTIQLIAFLGTIKDRRRCLIVCPASLVYNWYYEIQNFMPDLPCRVVCGTAMMRKHAIEESPEDAVLITSYDSLKRDFSSYSDMRFSCQVVDEAQYIKNAATQAAQSVKMISSDFKVALTGTPIENKLSELWSIFDYLMPGFFGSYSRFRQTFERRIVIEKDKAAEERMRNMISPFILRRLKKDVLDDLPDKIEEVYYAQMEGEQKELYEAHKDRLRLMLTKQSDADFNQNKIRLLAELTKLRQICCDPALFLKGYTAGSAKLELCMDKIREAIDSGHKVLLFSQFTSMLDILCKELEKENIAYHLLTGSTKASDRIDLVDRFQTDDVPVFCISLKAGGTGLNLTAADIVIHYDPWWNTAVENQASDRSHRIGQKHVVTVCRLILRDTIEDRILQLQKEKSDLSDRILSAEGISSAGLSREDLLKLL